ncbi:MAG: type II toxin-antitoxin system HicA family toxin [Dehalococcoidia bacterium]
MSRRDLIRHLTRSGCEYLREGGNHTVYVNRENRRSAAIPRHNEISDVLVRVICRELGVPRP